MCIASLPIMRHLPCIPCQSFGIQARFPFPLFSHRLLSFFSAGVHKAPYPIDILYVFDLLHRYSAVCPRWHAYCSNIEHTIRRSKTHMKITVTMQPGDGFPSQLKGC